MREAGSGRGAHCVHGGRDHEKLLLREKQRAQPLVPPVEHVVEGADRAADARPSGDEDVVEGNHSSGEYPRGCPAQVAERDDLAVAAVDGEQAETADPVVDNLGRFGVVQPQRSEG